MACHPKDRLLFLVSLLSDQQLLTDPPHPSLRTVHRRYATCTPVFCCCHRWQYIARGALGLLSNKASVVCKRGEIAYALPNAVPPTVSRCPSSLSCYTNHPTASLFHAPTETLNLPLQPSPIGAQIGVDSFDGTLFSRLTKATNSSTSTIAAGNVALTLSGRSAITTAGPSWQHAARGQSPVSMERAGVANEHHHDVYGAREHRHALSHRTARGHAGGGRSGPHGVPGRRYSGGQPELYLPPYPRHGQ